MCASTLLCFIFLNLFPQKPQLYGAARRKFRVLPRERHLCKERIPAASHQRVAVPQTGQGRFDLQHHRRLSPLQGRIPAVHHAVQAQHLAARHTGQRQDITTVASHFGLNVAIIPFTSELADDTLAKGLMRASQLNCRPIALEDVDCLFKHTRKPHDSAQTLLTLLGLLNYMDGLLCGGSDGLIMILTASMTSEMDEAMLRTARVDLSLAFTHADRFQARVLHVLLVGPQMGVY